MLMTGGFVETATVLTLVSLIAILCQKYIKAALASLQQQPTLSSFTFGTF